jgi:predicted metal-dependent enzyme (double-stranded beta helix superfamily)
MRLRSDSSDTWVRKVLLEFHPGRAVQRGTVQPGQTHVLTICFTAGPGVPEPVHNAVTLAEIAVENGALVIW